MGIPRLIAGPFLLIILLEFSNYKRFSVQIYSATTLVFTKFSSIWPNLYSSFFQYNSTVHNIDVYSKREEETAHGLFNCLTTF